MKEQSIYSNPDTTGAPHPKKKNVTEIVSFWNMLSKSNNSVLEIHVHLYYSSFGDGNCVSNTSFK